MSNTPASPLIGPDDSHFKPVALNGSPAPASAEGRAKAIELLSGAPIPSPAQPPAGKKTLSEIAAEILAGE